MCEVASRHIFLIYLQGVSKKRYFSDFHLTSLLDVGFCFFTCVMESEFRARLIQPLRLYPFKICTDLGTKKCLGTIMEENYTFMEDHPT